MTVPVMISLISGGLFILIIIIFVIWNKRSEKKQPDEPMNMPELAIDIKNVNEETEEVETTPVTTAVSEPEKDTSVGATEAKPETTTESETGPIPVVAEKEEKTQEEKGDESFELVSGSAIDQGTETSGERMQHETPEGVFGEDAGAAQQAAVAQEDVVEPDFGGMRDYGAIFEDETETEDDSAFTGEDVSIFVMDGEEREMSSMAIVEEEKRPGDTTSELFDIGKEADVTPEDIFSESEPAHPAAVLDDKPAEPDVSPEDIFADDVPKSVDEVLSPQGAPPVAEISEEDIESILDKVATKPPKVEIPKPPTAPKPEEMSPEELKRHEKARRIARVIINDIRNYNPEKLAEGIRAGNIMKTLGMEIERGRQLYIKRVPPDIARTTNYYRESLIKILADGRADLFGW